MASHGRGRRCPGPLRKRQRRAVHGSEVDAAQQVGERHALARDLVLVFQEGAVAAYGRDDLALRWVTDTNPAEGVHSRFPPAVDGEFAVYQADMKNHGAGSDYPTTPGHFDSPNACNY